MTHLLPRRGLAGAALGLLSAPQWGALIVCLFYAIAVFRWV